MILCDVNVLVHACARQSPRHKEFHSLVEELCHGEEKLAFHGPISAAVLWICTHPRIFDPPASASSVLEFLEALRKSRNAVPVDTGEAHWGIFRRLVTELNIRGGDVTDAWFAALAVEHDLEGWTADAGFDRFRGLRVRRLT